MSELQWGMCVYLYQCGNPCIFILMCTNAFVFLHFFQLSLRSVPWNLSLKDNVLTFFSQVTIALTHMINFIGIFIICSFLSRFRMKHVNKKNLTVCSRYPFMRLWHGCT